jgi:hypothetical protein
VVQLALPLHSGGFSLQLTTPLEANAVFLAAAGAADMAMLLRFRLFNTASSHCAALIARWAAQHDAAPGLWSPELWALDAPLLALVLLHAQRDYGRYLTDRQFDDLLDSALPSFESTRFRARPHSCACRLASIWLDSMPTSFPFTLSNSTYTSSACLQLGLAAGWANAPALLCDCGSTVLPGDSDLLLNYICLALQRTSRHNLITKSWRRIAAHTTGKPPFRFLLTPSPPPAKPSSGLSSPPLREAPLLAPQ